jgi:hypothetical protein
MRCYMVKTPGCVRLAPTGGEARAFRQAMVEERDVKKKDVEIEPVELKTAKPELLALFNDLLEAVDDKEDFEVPSGIQVVDKEAKKAEREAKKQAKPSKPEPKQPMSGVKAPPAKPAAKKPVTKKAPAKPASKKKGR